MTNKIKNTVFYGAVGVGIFAMSTSATAGGFTQYERSARAQGLSFAGVSAGSGGIQSMGFNPAALGGVTGTEVSVGLSYTSASFDAQPNVGGVPVGAAVDPGESIFSGYGYVGHRLSDQILVGLSITQPFSLSTQYNLGWLGQFDALNTSFDVVQYSPTIAYQPTPGVTFALSANILTLDMNYSTAAIAYNLDTVEYSFSLGAMFEIDEATTIGLAYHHGYDLNPSGTGLPTGGVPLASTASLNLPASFTVGAVHAINDDFRLMGEVQWQNWSDVNQIAFTLGGAPVLTDVYDLDDSLFIAFGGEMDLMQDDLTLRAGIAWDGTPTNNDPVLGQFPPPTNPLATNRQARLPQSDRLILSLGASYRASEFAVLDAGYSYAFSLDDALVNFRNAPAGSNALYDEDTHSVSLGLTVSF